MKPLWVWAALAIAGNAGWAADIKVDFADRLGPMKIDQFALGQGGLSSDPIWPERMAEVRALHPKVIRLFLQEYFDPMPEMGRYHWTTMDESVDLIRKTGATPLMTIAFKPKVLYPKIDHRIVEPDSWEAWDRLIYEMVRHYKQRGSQIGYWEVANEPDIGENGGCPYLFTAENYPRYYEHTVRAIKKADPRARVGGPALASVRSPLFPALLDHCEREKIPLDFVSWHIYNNEPRRIRETIEYAKGLLQKHPALKPETFLNEWNMSLRQPPQDPRFQPCFIAEVAYQMKDAGLDYACYYHIRDYQVDPAVFGRFMSPSGNAMMTRWWNRNTQWDGLFDYQNNVRPSYYAFKLISRLTGDRVRLESSDPHVHGFATRDVRMVTDNVLVWNYSDQPARAAVEMRAVAPRSTMHRILLQAAAPSDDENVRLKPVSSEQVAGDTARAEFELEPYGVTFVWFEHR